MDRFEAEFFRVMKISLRYLHSSMDRFEVYCSKKCQRKMEIYIPVWIDLKICRAVYAVYFIAHLHSSMDRFEVIAVVAHL